MSDIIKIYENKNAKLKYGVAVPLVARGRSRFIWVKDNIINGHWMLDDANTYWFKHEEERTHFLLRWS